MVLCTNDGYGVKKDYQKALYWLEKAAESNRGHNRAVFTVGEMYYEGKGVTKDYKKAVYWLKRSADYGHTDAQYNLALIYYTGTKTVPKNYKKAFYWFEKLAKENSGPAQLALSTMYHKGEGVIKNYVQAYKWLTLAKSHITDEDKDVDQLLNKLESQMTKTQIAEAQKLASQFKIQQ